MKIVKTNLKFKDLGTKPFAIETAPEHIKLHSVSLLVGKRGSGKSFFASNLLDWLDFDRIIIVSPTYDSNYAQFKRLGVAKEDIFDPDDPQVVQKIINIVNTERDELVDYRQKLKMLKELKEITKQVVQKGPTPRSISSTGQFCSMRLTMSMLFAWMWPQQNEAPR